MNLFFSQTKYCLWQVMIWVRMKNGSMIPSSGRINPCLFCTTCTSSWKNKHRWTTAKKVFVCDAWNNGRTVLSVFGTRRINEVKVMQRFSAQTDRTCVFKRSFLSVHVPPLRTYMDNYSINPAEKRMFYLLFYTLLHEGLSVAGKGE